MEFQSRAPALTRDPSEGHVQGQQDILWPIQDCLQVQVPSVVNGSMNEDKNVCICESESQTELIESEIKYLNSIIVAPSKMLVSNPPLSSSPPNCGYEELTASLTKYPMRRSSFYLHITVTTVFSQFLWIFVEIVNFVTKIRRFYDF